MPAADHPTSEQERLLPLMKSINQVPILFDAKLWLDDVRHWVRTCAREYARGVQRTHDRADANENRWISVAANPRHLMFSIRQYFRSTDPLRRRSAALIVATVNFGRTAKVRRPLWRKVKDT